MTPEASVGRVLHALTRLESVVAVLAICVSAAALLADIFAREFFGVGLFGSLRVAVYATAIGALLGFSICITHGAHIRVSLFDGLTPEAIRPAVHRAGHLLSFGICAYLAWWAIFYVRQTYSLGETDSSLGIQVWPIQVVMPWMFLSGALRYLSYFAFPGLAPKEASAAQ